MIKNILATIMIVAATPAMALPPEPTRDMRRMVVFAGDSITEGVMTDPAIPYRIPNKEKVCWQDRCYAAIVGQALDSIGIDSANRGYGGATSRDFDPNDRMESDVHFNYSPNGEGLFKEIPAADLVVIYLGTNDAVAFFENAPPTSGDAYEKHIEDMILTLRRRGVKRFLVITPPVASAWKGLPKGDSMLEYAHRVRQIARRHPRVHLVDAQIGFPDYGWQGESVHPNFRGQEYLAEAVLEGVLRVLRPRGWRKAIQALR